MNDDPSTQAPAGCEAFQRQLSDHADSGAPLTPELQVHLDGCEECARFAEQWLPGAPTILVRPVFAVSDATLRARILDAASVPEVIPFPTPTVSHPAWITWLGRIAACAVLAGFSYWLLNPVATPVRNHPAIAAAPTLTQGLIQMEGQTRHEQEVLQTALVHGGREVRGNVAWSISALE